MYHWLKRDGRIKDNKDIISFDFSDGSSFMFLSLQILSCHQRRWKTTFVRAIIQRIHAM
jgi:hypothetical protein